MSTFSFYEFITIFQNHNLITFLFINLMENFENTSDILWIYKYTYNYNILKDFIELIIRLNSLFNHHFTYIL